MKLKGGSLKADGQLAGSPSVLFDAVACAITPDAARQLAKDGAAVDWFRDAFGHLKAIAACAATREHIFKAGGIKPDAGVVFPEDTGTFLKLARTRHWDREPKVRDLA